MRKSSPAVLVLLIFFLRGFIAPASCVVRIVKPVNFIAQLKLE